MTGDFTQGGQAMIPKFAHLDLPTVMRRAFADRDLDAVARSRWEARLVDFIARVTSGDVAWR